MANSPSNLLDDSNFYCLILDIWPIFVLITEIFKTTLLQLLKPYPIGMGIY